MQSAMEDADEAIEVEKTPLEFVEQQKRKHIEYHQCTGRD